MIEEVSYDGEIVLQFLRAKRIVGENGDRYRLYLSDGEHFSSLIVLSKHLNHLCANDKLTEYAIIGVKEYIVSAIQGQRALIVKQLEILVPGSDVGRRFGEPVGLIGSDAIMTPKEMSQTQRRVLSSISNVMPPPSSPHSLRSTPNPMAPTVIPKRAKSNDLIGDLNLKTDLFTICARVFAKSAIRPWSNAYGSGTLFNMDVMDESGQIRVTAFNSDVDKYYNKIEV